MRFMVRDVMTREVVAVHGDTPFKDVAETLVAHGVSAVPVVDGENHVIGVVSEADLLRKEEFKEQYYGEGYRPPLRTRLRRSLSKEGHRSGSGGDTAAGVMSAPAVTIRSHASVVSAMRLMAEHGVKRLPVVGRDGRLAGIVSRGDLMRVFLRTDAEIEREVREDVLGHSLWAGTSDVRATVDKGVVTLTGSMRLRSDARIAVRMVERVNGVVEVIDHVTWREND
ncbi:BON domain-containing protein [Nonomuraea maritima]|uniref:BON domain-containing protein n=1 Tax=Nonomuraea maritima TaxID=683260 RepID=A0A1G9BMI8_9ACTN|nr:CBS domain-containing protein [Nonomuraea maritima]SDK40721.1 BON domain-containing protein [Nonomuraea maritima]